MSLTIAAVFLALSAFLFWLIRKGHVSNDTLQALTGVATVVSFIAAVVAIIISLPTRDKETPQPTSPHSLPGSANSSDSFKGSTEKDSGIQLYRYWSEEQVRNQISKLLEANNAKGAIDLLQLLRDSATRDEECDHIFRYSLNNGKLKDAGRVVQFFQSPGKKDSALKELSLEDFKK